MDDLDKFWSRYIVKTWVVTLKGGPRNKPKRNKLIVRARTEKGAINTAIANSSMFKPSNCTAYVGLAHPVYDLGAEPSPCKTLANTKNMTDIGINHYMSQKQ